MKFSVIFIYILWLFLWQNPSINASLINGTLINAGEYEERFHNIFQGYFKNRVSLVELTEITNQLNTPGLKLDDIPNSTFPKKCLICRAFTYSMLQYYRDSETVSINNLKEYLYELCTILAKMPDYVCHGITDIYTPIIKYIVTNRHQELSPDRICGIILQYNYCSEKKDHISFTIEMTNDHKNETIEYRNAASKPLIIAHLSDFHYDPYYQSGSSSNCETYICCRNSSVPKPNTNYVAGYWGDYYACDSPGYLVENICSQVAENHKDIDIVYYTGDFVDHFDWLTTKDSVKRSIEFITTQIKEKFPNKPVVMVIGNHDIHPSNSFILNEITDVELSSKWLYDFVADLWSNWLPQSALETLRNGGYYTFVVQSGLRIIVLNNNLCFSHNIWVLYGVNDMKIQLEWLRDTLIEAKINGERVHILGHIPPNTSSCIRVWNREYNKIVRHFADIISGQFNGHTHTDEFTLYYRKNSNEAINIAWNGGSGTAFSKLNSNYRLYKIDSSTFNVIDHETWIFNLTEANQNPNTPPRWFKEYSFREEYGLSDLNLNTVAHLVNVTFRNDKRLLQRYWSLKVKLADPRLTEGCNDVCLEQKRLETNGDTDNEFMNDFE